MAAAAAGELPPGTGPRSAAAGEPPGSRAGYHLPAADPPQPLRDMYGFAVKPEFRELYQQFAPIYAAEEAERAERWGEFMLELKALLPSSPGGDEAALLSRLLTHLGDRSGSGSSNGGEGCAWAADSDSAEAAPPLLSPAHAAALLQRLASLVQAGLPMAKRGIFWRLFLNVESKRQAGEFGRLVAEVEALEGILAGSRAGGSGAGGSGVCSPACSGEGAASAAKAAAAASGMQLEHHHAHEQQYCRHGQLAGQPGAAGVFSLVADASSSGAAAAAAAAADATLPPKQQYHRASAFSRVSTFSIIPLEEEEEDDEHQPQSPPPLPLPQPQQQHQEEQHQGTQALPAQRTPGLPSKTAQAPPAALTPASALRTPLVTSSTDGSSRGCEPGLHSGGSGGGSTAERWRQQDYLSQIDKDLHRTFPGHPCMDDNGRAMLRRILAAYACRNPSVGYCQGLNFLGATFLLFMQEEDAFWCLCALIEDILGSGYFDERMVPVQVDVLVFGHLLQGRFPTLWRHLQELDVDAASVTMHWFLCCFLNSLPLDSTLRVWDQLFFEGSPVVLFRVALALVEIYDQALMTTCESSDAYMALQACAQMTFDGSRLVDTAACGYAHLQRAGLAALRQRYKPEVLDNLRVAFQSEEEYELYVASEGVSPEGGGDSSSAGGDCGDGRVPHRLPSFADRFRTLSSALLEQEEAALRLQHQQRRGGDSGHLSPPRSLGSSSRHSSPGPDAGGPSGPGSPLARVQHAVRGLTSRLMPSSLPSLLPAGAMTVSGQELAPMSAGVGSIASGRSSRSAQAAATAAQQPASFATQPLPSGSSTEQEKPAAGLRRLSVCDHGAAAAGSSPTSSLSHSAGTGATLGRQAGGGSRLTPFSDADAVLTVQQQQQGGACTPDRQVLGTASRLRPAALLLAHGLGSGAAAAAPVTQSQPATPTEHITRDLMQQPESSHRRAMTAGHQDGTHGGHTRRRRRLTIDLLLNMANVRPDLQQPAVAAALAIAANPSPRVGGRSGSAAAVGTDVKFPPGQCCQHSAPTSTLLELVAESSFCEDGSCGCSSSGLELLLPVRALRFDEEDARGSQQGEELPACAQEGSTGGLSASRRAATAPPAALLPPDSPVVGAAAQQQLQPAPRRHTADEPSLAAAAALAAASSPACLKRGSSQGGRRSSSSDSAAVQLEAPTALPGPGASAAAAVPSPARGPSLRCRLQQVQQVEAPALLPVVAQLQEEVAVAESRRHEAEQAAAAQRQTAADLRQQLRKVEQQVAAKEALVAELNSRLEASSSSLSELSSEVSAKQLAVLAEEAAAERRRRELAAADALIRRLMDAVAHVQHGGRSGGSMGGALSVGTGSSSARSEASGSPRLGQGQGQHAGSTASSSVAGGTSVSSAASSGAGNASPQSSIGSVPMAVGAGRWGGVPLPRDSASSHA